MNKGNHAVVIGGSIAGLLAARVLSEHFGRVSIIERDALPLDFPADRKGVPQARHVHGLWGRGLSAIERLLPGLTLDLMDGGALSGDAARDFVWHQFGSTKLREPVGVGATLMTRPLLEWHVRRRVLALSNVELIGGRNVTGFASDAEHARITGVLIKQPDASKVPLYADLVVDASGRGGLAARWLEGLGYGSPPETKIRIDVTHATCTFHRSRAGDALGYVAGASAPFGRRAGTCFAVEDDRWQMTLSGKMGEEPPGDLRGFREYARGLPIPQLYDIACGERALTEVTTYRFPFNRRRHYERLGMFPDGLLVLGDALASFSPVYAQGMTLAALQVEALEHALRQDEPLRGIARRFFPAAAEIIDLPWAQAVWEDLRYPEAEGRRPLLMPAVNAYVAKLHRAAAIDPRVCQTFFEVTGLEKSAAHLFTPEMVWRAMFPAHPAVAARLEPLPDPAIDAVAAE